MRMSVQSSEYSNNNSYKPRKWHKKSGSEILSNFKFVVLMPVRKNTASLEVPISHG